MENRKTNHELLSMESIADDDAGWLAGDDDNMDKEMKVAQISDN